MSIDNLFQFCIKLGLSPSEIYGSENPQFFRLATDISVNKLKQISRTELENLVSVYSNAITLVLGREIKPALEIRSGILPTTLDEDLQFIQGMEPTQNPPVNLTIDKNLLLEKNNLVSEKWASLFYLFRESLIGLLSKTSLPELEEILFPKRDLPTIVFLAGGNVHYSSSLLTIISQGLFKNYGLEENIKIPNRIKRYQDTIPQMNWIGFRINHLTPLHFLCNRQQDLDLELELSLTNHFLHLCILFTANRSSFDDSLLTSFFASSDRTATLKLKHIGQSNKPSNLVMGKLVVWPYGGNEDDRLTIFQNVVAREISSDDPDANFYSFIDQLNHILDESRWHYRIFIDNKINNHFEQVQNVAEYVSQVAQQVSAFLDSIRMDTSRY